MKSAITWKLYKLETHIFKNKECNETMIFILRSQQLQKKSNVVVVVAITGNYEIGHNLKSMQIRNPIFSRPMF